MEKIIGEFVGMINDFNQKMITKYNLSDNPWCDQGLSFNKKGMIEDYDYWFHGAGCTLIRNGITCWYDVAPLNGKEIKFTSDAILKFINTHPEFNDKEYKLDIIEIELAKLIEKGIVSWVTLFGHIYNYYQIEGLVNEK